MPTFEEVAANFGINKSEVKNAQNVSTPIENYVRQASQVFVDKMKEKIEEEKANASFSLSQSLNVETTFSGGVYESEFSSDEIYADWRNDGVSGTERQLETPYSFKSTHPSKAMVEDIREWIRYKGFSANEWAVATSILKRGIEGIEYIEESFSEDNLRIFEDELLTVVANTADGIITNVEPRFK